MSEPPESPSDEQPSLARPSPAQREPRTSRRTFSEREKSRLRDVDAVRRARIINIVVRGVSIGGIVGFLGGSRVGHPLLGAAVGAVVVMLVVLLMVEGSGRVAGTLYNPSGRSTPPKREYSHAASLAVRGLHQDAVEAYRVAITQHPEDPHPYLHIARLLRDEMDRAEQAAPWFRRALREADVTAAQELLITRELTELYGRLGTPEKGAPLLARLADQRQGTPEGERAAAELAALKELMDRDGKS